jgi:hypothetical protein
MADIHSSRRLQIFTGHSCVAGAWIQQYVQSVFERRPSPLSSALSHQRHVGNPAELKAPMQAIIGRPPPKPAIPMFGSLNTTATSGGNRPLDDCASSYICQRLDDSNNHCRV